MAVTVNINGLSLSHKKSGGMVKSTLPDFCLTPAANNAPIPYTNVAFSRDLAKGPKSITADGKAMCAVKGSEFSKSIGDEPGSGGGVTSGVHKHKATWLSWSPNVFMEGKPVCRLTDKMLLNRGNSASVGGEQQKWLGGDDPTMDELCDIACNCLLDTNVVRKQQCVAEEIKKRYYDGDYPSDFDNGLCQEVVMMHNPAEGLWAIVMNRAGTGPTSNPFRGGSIRPDVLCRQNGESTRLIEMKFPGDTMSERQAELYPEAADDIGAEYEELNVEDDCSCGGGGGTAGAPVTEPAPYSPPAGFDTPSEMLPPLFPWSDPRPPGGWCRPTMLPGIWECVRPATAG